MNKVEIEERIDALRKVRGAAVLDGKQFPADEITKLEVQLSALDDAEAERVRRDREAAQKELEAEQARLRSRVATLEQERLAAIAEAEAAARKLAEAFSKVIEIGEEQAATVLRLTNVVPIPLYRGEIGNRLACRLSAVMQTVRGQRYRIGHLDWLAGHYSADTNWQEAERALLQKHIEHIQGN